MFGGAYSYRDINSEKDSKNSLTFDEKMMHEISLIQDQKLTYREKEAKISKIIEGNTKLLSEAENESDYSNVELDNNIKLLKFCNPFVGFDKTVPELKEGNTGDILNITQSLLKTTGNMNEKYHSFDIKKIHPSDVKLLNLHEFQTKRIINNLNEISTNIVLIKERLEYLQTRFSQLLENAKKHKTPLKNPLIFLLEKIYPPSLSKLIFSFCKNNEYTKVEDIEAFNPDRKDIIILTECFSKALYSDNFLLMKYIVCKFGMFLNYFEIFQAFREYETKNEISISNYRIKPNIIQNPSLKKAYKLHKIFSIYELCEFFIQEKSKLTEKMKDVYDPTELREPVYLF